MTSPFGPLFDDLVKLLAGQGPDAWFESATQLALSSSRGSDGDPNPEPAERQRLEALAPLVARRIDALLSVAGPSTTEVVNRSGLTLAALAQWRPLLAPALAAGQLALPDDAATDPMAHMMAALTPLLLGLQLGSVAGHFSERAWSLAVLPLPRIDERRLIAVNNVAAFATSWSLDRDEVAAFALAHEQVAALVLTRPGTGDALRALLLDSVREAAAHQGDIIERLQGMLGEGTSDMGEVLAHPESLLEGLEGLTDGPAADAINAATAALLALFDAVALEVTTALMGPQPALAEAYRRHRLLDARGEDAAAALFGVATHGPHHERAGSFVATVSAEHGLEAFDAFLRVDGLPSPAELDDPAAWYARVSTSPLA